MERIIAYIDGFNLYYGLRAKGWKRYYWFNLRAMCENLLKPDQQLVLTKYFTARVSQPPDKHKRQSTYIEALQTLPALQIYFGKYQLNPRQCRNCGYVDNVPNEKMTDVNIAVELLVDAFQDHFDTALLISADSDLTAPVKSVLHLFPAKRIVCAFPLERSSKELVKVSTAHFTIGRGALERSLLPSDVIKADGFVLRCPSSWH